MNRNCLFNACFSLSAIGVFLALSSFFHLFWPDLAQKALADPGIIQAVGAILMALGIGAIIVFAAAYYLKRPRPVVEKR